MPPGNFRSHLPPRRDCVAPGMNEAYDKAVAVVVRLEVLIEEVEACRVARDGVLAAIRLLQEKARAGEAVDLAGFSELAAEFEAKEARLVELLPAVEAANAEAMKVTHEAYTLMGKALRRRAQIAQAADAPPAGRA